MKARHVVLWFRFCYWYRRPHSPITTWYMPKVQAPVLTKTRRRSMAGSSIVGGKAAIDMSNTVDRLTPFRV